MKGSKALLGSTLLGATYAENGAAGIEMTAVERKMAAGGKKDDRQALISNKVAPSPDELDLAAQDKRDVRLGWIFFFHY